MTAYVHAVRVVVSGVFIACAFLVTVGAQPTGYCETDCGPTTGCDYQCMYGGSFTTCEAYGAGCQSECGDGICSSGEDHDNCEVDCVNFADAETNIVWPNSGPAWSSHFGNWPNQDEVSSCFGNCGPGCSSYGAVCGSPAQYWELEVLSSPSTNSYNTCYCVDNYNTMACGEVTTYTASGRWTYYGWKANGCFSHDTTCRLSWWTSLWVGVFGYVVTPGWAFAPYWIQLIINPYVTCKLSYASFLYGGGCAGASAQEWPYDVTLYTDEFAFDYYDYGPPGSCYSGPPTCGDGICQPNNCMYDGSGTDTPGSGCEEYGGFNSERCWTDCP